ncbi:MAG: glycine betaine/proline transport system permease protein [Gaiellaceae bacterium]|nr:glycine betaine/proline transport system permease protein [Gaiellaceae bacterium]
MASVVAETATTPAAIVVHRTWWRGRLVQVVGIVALMYVAYRARGLDYPWPNRIVWNSLSVHLDDFQVWLLTERGQENQSIVFTVFEGFSSAIDHLVEWFSRLLLWLTWVGATVAGTALVLRFGGLRAALISLFAFATFALLGLWEESMETLALMLVAVGLSLLVGIPLGVAAGRSARFHRVITPVLDAMQIVPAFAYLMPVVILFSIGPAAAVVSTMIYAIPPAIRITALGIRGVPVNTVEAATSMGATRLQLLGKVQLPLARRLILLGVNQTILFALSMVVIAGLIGGGGLGAVVTSGLYSNPALAILAGLVIVVMAMAVDRSTEAIADRTDPAAPHVDETRKRRDLQTLALGAAIVGGVGLSKVFGVAPAYPDEVGSSARTATLEEWLLAKIQVVLDYIQDPTTWVFAVTERVGTFILQHFLLPLQEFLVEAPWLTTVVGLTAIAFVVSGLRPALTTLLMLGVIGFTGVWALAMDTLSQVLVATAIAVVLGVVLGVLAAESDRFSRAMRPVNDLLQTLPQLVYIIPFIYLMPVSIVPGIVAGVLYAFPVTLRLVERGVRDVAPTSVEAASAFGSSRRQVLTKVKLPLAGDAVMLGVNQAIIMVLAVVVIAGLVGSGGLGYEVAQGLVRGQFGQGVIASVAILALGIALDRVTQGTRQSKKEGIA